MRTAAIKTSPQNTKTKLELTIPVTSTATPRMTTRTPTVIRPLRIGSRLKDHGRSVRHDLAHRLADLGGIEAHHNDAIGAHCRRVAHEAVDRMPARFLEELRIFMDLAPDERAQARPDVASDPARAHDDAKALAQGLFHAVPCDTLRGGDEHRHLRSIWHPTMPRFRVRPSR